MNKYIVLYGNYEQTVDADDAVLAAAACLKGYVEIFDKVNTKDDFEVHGVNTCFDIVIPLYEVVAFLAAKAEENDQVAP